MGHGNLTNVNPSSKYNYQLWQSTETLSDFSVFPRVYALVHVFFLKPRSCYQDWPSCPAVSVPALPMWFVCLSWVRHCTATDLWLLKRIIQLIISLSAVLPQKCRNGQIRREMSVFVSNIGFTAPKDTIALMLPGLYDIREMAPMNKKHFIFNMVHIKSHFFHTPRCISVTRAPQIVFSLDFNFYKDSSHHVMSIKAYSKERKKKSEQKFPLPWSGLF